MNTVIHSSGKREHLTSLCSNKISDFCQLLHLKLIIMSHFSPFQTPFLLSIMTPPTTAPTPMEMERWEKAPAPYTKRLAPLPLSVPASLPPPPPGQPTLLSTPSHRSTAAALNPSSSSPLTSRVCAATPGATTTVRWRGEALKRSRWRSRSLMIPSCWEDKAE